MSDKWEVVGNGKPRKPRPVNNGPTNSVPTTKSIGNLPGNVSSQKPARRKKHIGPRDSKVAKLPGSDDEFEDTRNLSIHFVLLGSQISIDIPLTL